MIDRVNDLRISIVGCSGSGKSTLARRLETSLGLPRLELDGVYHQPDWTPLPDDDFQNHVRAFLGEHRSWVIDGNYRVVQPDVWSHATTVVWLHPPRRVAMWRVGWRSVRRSIARTELWNGNRETLNDLLSRDPGRSMLAWTWRTHGQKKARFDAQFADPRWNHLDRKCFTRNAEVQSWLADLSTEKLHAASPTAASTQPEHDR